MVQAAVPTSNVAPVDQTSAGLSGLSSSLSSAAPADPTGVTAALAIASQVAAIQQAQNQKKKATNIQRASDAQAEDASQREEANRRQALRAMVAGAQAASNKTGMGIDFSNFYADPRAGTTRHLPGYDPSMDSPLAISDAENLRQSQIATNIHHAEQAAQAQMSTIDAATQANIDSGMSPEDAASRAREDHKNVNGVLQNFNDQYAQDVKSGKRSPVEPDKKKNDITGQIEAGLGGAAMLGGPLGIIGGIAGKKIFGW